MNKSGSLSQDRIHFLKLRKLKIKPKQRPLLILIALMAMGGLAAWYFKSNSQSNMFFLGNRDAGLLKLSGRIEGYETNIGAKTGGRVDYVAVREGALVHKGQVVAQIDDAEVQAQLRGATAEIAAAQARAAQANQQLDIISSQLREAQLNFQQSQGDAQGRIYQAQANVSQSEAQLAAAEAQVSQAAADLKLAQVNRNRYAQLASQGAVNQLQADQAETTFETAEATLKARQASVAAAVKQVNAAKGALVQAQSTGLNPNIRQAQIATLQEQLKQARSQLLAAQADVKNAIANRQQIAAQMSYLKVVSPIDGIVTARSVEPGAVVSSGKTLLTVINPATVYLRGYVPEGSIGKVRVGERARVFLDSAPDHPLAAKVSEIDPEASFTPENIYFKNDRVKQVFGIKISIDHPDDLAKPGMPADGEIMTR